MKKTFVIEVAETDNNKKMSVTITRTNDGFSPIEIIGLMEATKKGILKEIEKGSSVSENIIFPLASLPSTLKKRRLLLNLSMQEVSDKTGVSKATISRVEKGSDAYYDTVMRLDRFYTENGA